MLTNFHWDEAKKIKKIKKNQNQNQNGRFKKKLSFSTPPILNIFCENFRDWSLRAKNTKNVFLVLFGAYI
jgi:hypothetical protein